MKKWIVCLLCLTLLCSLFGCAGDTAETTQSTYETTETLGNLYKVGVCLPNDIDTIWVESAEALTAELEEMGCEVVLEIAQDTPMLQADQVKALLSHPVDALIVAAVDSLALTDSLAGAEVPVIAYDRLLMNTDKVSAYVGFDSLQLGTDIALKIVEEKALDTALTEGRTHTIEFFMGDYRNHSSLLFYQGVMLVLQEYFDNGVLTCPSGRTRFEDTCIESADRLLAQEWCDAFEGQWPEILLCSTDSIANGCADSLNKEELPKEQWPLITGQSAHVEAVARIAQDKQCLTVYYDAYALADYCATALQTLFDGETVGEITTHNGVIDVPTDLFIPELVHKDNYERLLIDTGIYTAQELAR